MILLLSFLQVQSADRAMYNTEDPQVLAARDGVKPSCVVLPSQGSGSTLGFLLQRFPSVARSTWMARMARSEVIDEFGRPVHSDTPFLQGLRVYYYREVVAEPEVPFEAQVLYQDAHIVVADKPHFLPVVPGGRYLQNTLLVRLKKQLDLSDLSPVHRIDRDTAGVVFNARSAVLTKHCSASERWTRLMKPLRLGIRLWFFLVCMKAVWPRAATLYACMKCLAKPIVLRTCNC
jgi:hypothetical protein